MAAGGEQQPDEFGSVGNRRAEIAVPGYLANWDLINAALPAPLIGLGRRLIGDNRALTSVDHVARSDYETAIRPPTS